jgi:hypothetical protein
MYKVIEIAINCMSDAYKVCRGCVTTRSRVSRRRLSTIVMIYHSKILIMHIKLYIYIPCM